MLHEALLSLWGHPSRVLSNDAVVGDTSHAISPPERELLASIVHLSELHVDLRRAAADITTSHESTICRAVANAVVSHDLAAFRGAVLEIEERVLRKDSSLVGAYNIVPLAAIISEFSGWTRRLEWLWRLLQFMAGPTGSENTSSRCTGAKLIDRLRVELQTGYADLELTASRLLQVAERTWLKQASAWLLYGRLPGAADGNDFFIQQSDDVVGPSSCCLSLDSRETRLIPGLELHYTLALGACVRDPIDGFIDAVCGQIPELHTQQRTQRLNPQRHSANHITAGRTLHAAPASRFDSCVIFRGLHSHVTLPIHPAASPPRSQSI
jgi:hypothetical protein